MLKLEQYVRIRRMVLIDGLSQREVARKLGHSRKTVRKALEESTPKPYSLAKPRKRPVLDPFTEVIDVWLKEDEKRPRKQRHSAYRIYNRLRDEYKFRGCYGTVSKYVRTKQRRNKEVFFPLQFDPGEEAQVDWGEARILQNGKERKIHLFCMRLCYSGASFVRAYERETQEAFLDGHVRGLEFFGGISKRIAYDNLKIAVITIGKGQERNLTKAFLRLKSHFLFETRFCNPGRGNEKGHVENLVKYAQRNFLTPLAEVTSMEELNSQLIESCRQHLERPGMKEGKSYTERFGEEKSRMQPIPKTVFHACKEESRSVSKYSLVRFATNDYSVPILYAYKSCVIKGYVDRVEIFSQGKCIAKHKRSYGSSEYILEPMHFLPLLERKPGGLDNARPFKGHFWGEGFAEMRKELEFRYEGEGTRKFIQVLGLFQEYPAKDVREAVALCVKRCAWSEEAVRNVLSYEPMRLSSVLDLTARPTLQGYGDGIHSASLYDQLLGEEALS